MSLLRMQVQQLRAFHVLHLPKDAHQLLHVMSVKRSEITDVHALKDVLLLGNDTLEGIGQTLQAVLTGIAHQPLAGKPSVHLELDGVA